MSLYKCKNCGVVENTALAWSWPKPELALCSECDPDIGVWHGKFPREQADENYVEGSDGFLVPKPK